MISSHGSFRTLILCHYNFTTTHMLVNGPCPVLTDHKVLTMALKENFARTFLVVKISEALWHIRECYSIFFRKRRQDFGETAKHAAFFNLSPLLKPTENDLTGHFSNSMPEDGN